MRPIKFRAWDKRAKRMLQHESFGVKFPLNKLPLDDNNFVLMQFTGLVDKHGKEIYEGDVVEFQTIRGVVEFKDVAFQVMHDVVDGHHGTGTLREGKPLTHDYKILGNSYEHPDLLHRREGG